MLKQLIVALCFAFLLNKLCVNCDCNIHDLYKYWGSYTDYDEIRGENNNFDFKLDGCNAHSIWFITKTGSRYPSNDEIKDILDKIPKIQEALSQQGNELCEKENELIKIWKPPITTDDDHNITIVGTNQVIHLANRFRERFKSILNNSNSIFYARESVGRTKESVLDFLTEFFKHNLTLSPKIESHKEDNLLDYTTTCKKFKNFENNNTYCRFEHNFTNTNRYKDDLNSFFTKLNITKLENLDESEIFDVVFKTCAYEYLILNRNETSKTWCAPFSKQIFKTIELNDDLLKYCKYGYKYKISAEMTCDLRKQLLEYLINITKLYPSRIPNYFYFIQDNKLLPFLTSLGLYRGQVSYNDYSENTNRLWRSSLLDPMNANLLFVIYKCSKSYSMKVFHNEKPLMLPNNICDVNYVCDIDRFIDALQTTTSKCSFNISCEGTVTDEDLVSSTSNNASNNNYKYSSYLIVIFIQFVFNLL